MNPASRLRRVVTIVVAVTGAIIANAGVAKAYEVPAAMAHLRVEVHQLAEGFPATSAVAVLDLSTGLRAGYNANASMPAASTIKVPVMVAVFRDLAAGRFDLNRRVTLFERDKDYGSGDLCDAPDGSTYRVSTLLEKMIDISDNTAANMLIRLVHRQRINQTMHVLGLTHTLLRSDVRTSGWSIREDLRTSPADMVRLFSLMAKRTLVNAWSSNEMISILEEDQINTLLPEPLPDDVAIAHKTGSLFDTLDDAGIVYADDEPYVIAVMTTGLSSESAGRTFIRALSLDAFTDEEQLATWRSSMGISAFNIGPSIPSSPDVRYWQGSTAEAIGG